MKRISLLILVLLLPLLAACGTAPVSESGESGPLSTETTPVVVEPEASPAEPQASPTEPEASATALPDETPTKEATMEPTESPATPESTPAPEPTVAATTAPSTNPTPDMEVQAPEDVIFIYERQGGFAGFCDTLTVTMEVAVWTSCMRSGGKVELNQARQQRLRELTTQFASFQSRSEDNPGGSDSMTQIIRFFGSGTQLNTPELEQELQLMASELLGEAYQTE